VFFLISVVLFSTALRRRKVVVRQHRERKRDRSREEGEREKESFD